MITVYISIGNSDDRLTQAEWHAFYVETNMAIRLSAAEIHAACVSDSVSTYQNACWCAVLLGDGDTAHLRVKLAELAAKYRQDSITWAVAEVEFIGPVA